MLIQFIIIKSEIYDYKNVHSLIKLRRVKNDVSYLKATEKSVGPASDQRKSLNSFSLRVDTHLGVSFSNRVLVIHLNNQINYLAEYQISSGVENIIN